MQRLTPRLRVTSKDKDELEVLYRAVESVSNGVLITDPNLDDNPIIYSNPAFSKMTGYSHDEIVGKNCRFLQGTDRDQPQIDDVRQAIKEHKSITTILRNYRKDGSMFWNELTISPVFDEHDNCVNFIGVQNDVTARVESERRVSEFYSAISHELMTPLASVHGALTTIEDGSAGDIDPQALRIARIGLSNSRRLIQLIDNILDWKKLESGRFRVVIRNHNPSELITAVTDDMSIMANQAGVTLVPKVTTKHNVHCDRESVEQVLVNLIANAIRFAPSGSAVEIHANDAENNVRFDVIDRGAGIHHEDAPLLFQRFQQLNTQDERMRGGTGLGLSIAKSIIELNNGSIGYLGVTGGGSNFWFELPRG